MTGMRLSGNSGMALTVAIVVIIILVLLAGFSMNFGYNRKRLIDTVSGRRDVINYRAQAGLVDALTRIRLNATSGLTPGGSFTNPAYDPAPYQLDVDGIGGVVDPTTKICSSGCDAQVDIGPVENASTGARAINSIGLDV